MKKNSNKVRKVHRVGRIVYFNNIFERACFMKLCKDKIYNPVIMDESFKECQLFFTIELNDFNELINSLGLVSRKVLNGRNRYWEMPKEV